MVSVEVLVRVWDARSLVEIAACIKYLLPLAQAGPFPFSI